MARLYPAYGLQAGLAGLFTAKKATLREMKMTPSRKLNFPKIKKVELSRFSLYVLKPNIDIEIPDGVFCLAGANGLGKSTFLAAINFAITGMVLDTTNHGSKYVEKRLRASHNKDFFSGKIAEDDCEAATITVHLEIGNRRCQLTRGMFEPNELRALSIFPHEKDFTELNAEERQKEYEQIITRDIGLGSFDQFVFLQHFVFTFDESRRLLLWDNKNVLTQALYLCVGDYEQAQAADKLYREMERAGSLARSASGQASQIHGKIGILRDALEKRSSQEELLDIKEQHELRQEEWQRQQTLADDKKAQLSDAELKWMEASAELTSLQAEYGREFSRHADLSPPSVLSDPVATLREIDKRIVETKKLLKTAIHTKDRLSAEFQATQTQADAIYSELKAFESANEKLISQYQYNADGIEKSLQKRIEEMKEFLQIKKEKYAERDKKKQKLEKIQRKLEEQYAEAETVFVPSWRKLAMLFLGIDLNIRMDSNTSVTSFGLSFTLEMRGDIRRKKHELSESQRFFLDISFRMALAQYCCHPESQACLFIDTPEGSLDIAYESRAGQMFGIFAQSGHNIIMTANINSSQISRKLAAKCGKSMMALHRMAPWTELSDVQMEEEALFREACEQIETALESGGDTDATD
ncbi:MAG: AAA family ATPase [Gammaproteobacteria bacterium]|nr:AAA family ATPase [Gammaproteobacteria bacterium]